MLRLRPRFPNEPDFREWSPSERRSWFQEQFRKGFVQIGRDEFRKNPAQAVRFAIHHGRVVIVDKDGKRVATISSPKGQRKVIDE